MTAIATSKNIAQLSLLNIDAILANARWENRSWKDDADPKRRLELKREKVRARLAYRRFFLMFACQGAPHGLLPSNRTDSTTCTPQKAPHQKAKEQARARRS